MTNVLVVDDDQALLRLLAAILRYDGLDVATFCDGPQGIESLDQQRPDLIVLDLNMPGMDGREFYKEARDHGYDGPVIICSAFNARQARRELGAEGALDKPFDPDVLVGLVSELIATTPHRNGSTN